MASSHMPSCQGSSFQVMVARETVEGLAAARDRGLTEADVQTEVDRLLALKPYAPVPARVVLYEVPGNGPSAIESPLKWIALRKATGEAMRAALADTGVFSQVDFLPEILLPSGDPSDLKMVRIAAARAQADGVLIFTTEAGYEYEPNGWAILYPTIIGLALAPGSTRTSLCVSKAILLDVHTGYIYSVVESYAQDSVTAPIAVLDPEQLEYDVRLQVIDKLAAAVAAKARNLTHGN
jgi:hypothetical protein